MNGSIVQDGNGMTFSLNMPVDLALLIVLLLILGVAQLLVALKHEAVQSD